MPGPDKQAAMVAVLLRRPFKRRAGAGFLQKTQARCRTGFERTTDTATVARLPLGRFGRRCALKMDNLLCHKQIMNQVAAKCSNTSSNFKEHPMIKLISVVLATVFALGSVSAIACGDKAKDEKQMSTPSKPKV
jgi:hypothetical protein